MRLFGFSGDIFQFMVPTSKKLKNQSQKCLKLIVTSLQINSMLCWTFGIFLVVLGREYFDKILSSAGFPISYRQYVILCY